MAIYNIKDLKLRKLRTPPVSHRRLENTSLELDVPLEHLEDEVLPLVSHETLGVGYGFDRLYAIDLKADKPIPYPLPSRHELSKFYRDKKPERLAYGGAKLMFGGLGRSAQSGKTVWQANDRADFDNFADDGAGIASGNSKAVWRMQSLTGDGAPNNMIKEIAGAFIGNGRDANDRVCIGYKTNDDGINSDINLDPSTMNNMGLRVNRNLYQQMYSQHSPSAWETILTDREMYAEIPKLLPYLDKAFFSLYERDKLSSWMTRVRDPTAMVALLSMVEAIYTIRRGRFSKNVSTTNKTGYSMKNIRGTTGTSAPAAITNGVVNNYFSYMENGKHSTLIAPWWLIQKLSTVLYEDTERDEEIRDMERGDITQFFTLLTEAMEVERGLTFSSDSTLPMLVFEKYAEGKVRDFSNFKDTTSALAATLLGFDSPRDAYYNRPNTAIGKVPYFSSLLTSSGTIIGKEHAEFTDRIREQSEHTFLSPSPEMFKQGMQYANGFDYTTMVTRTRFGDASMELKIHPMGWFRGVKLTPTTAIAFPSTGGTSGDSTLFKNAINLVFFPLYNWGQLGSTCDTNGLLPKNMNGAAYATSLKSSGIVEYAPSTPAAQPLWPDNYHRPGVDNYSALLMRTTDEMFKSWTDRGDTVRSEGAVFPTFTNVNMMAEMTFTTPLAMFQRNFPYLRKMFTRGSQTRVPVRTDKSFDFMTVGDNYFGMSQYHNTGSSSGPLALRDRALFSTSAHTRTGSVQVAPIVVPMTNTPENWVALFQTRDAMYFLTSLLSEPIMDAYTSSTTSTGTTNGYGTSRLMVYQGPKTFEGIVEDVFCTPIIGTGDDTHDYSPGSGTTTSVHPASSAIAVNNYVMFLLSPARMTTGTVICSRTTTSAVLPSDGSTAMPLLPSLLSEDDFIPGLHWTKKAFTPWPQEAGVDLTWAEAFSTPDHKEPQASGPQIGYMAATVESGTAIGNSFRFGDPVADPLNFDMDFWRLKHGLWLQDIRADLEFQRSSPTFYIFDLDITDMNESMLRASLFPLGKSTVGPLTFVGGLGAEGQQTQSESITGPTVFEIIDLTTGAGDLDMTASDPDDLSAGEENPSMHIASAVEV